MADSIWMQCALKIAQLNEIRLRDGIDNTVDMEDEINRLSILVTQELKIDVTGVILRVVQTPENGFDDPIPF
jgi:hypothetical protein